MLRHVALAVLILAGLGPTGACSGDDGSNPPDAPPTTTAPPSPLEAAAEAANVHVAGVVRADVEDLIQAICDGQDAGELAADVVALDISDSEDLRLVLEGIGNGAMRLCPEVAAETPELINDAHSTAVALVAG